MRAAKVVLGWGGLVREHVFKEVVPTGRLKGERSRTSSEGQADIIWS